MRDKSDRDIAVYVAAILVLGGGIAFAFLQTNANPYSLMGRFLQIIRHPLVISIFLIILLIALYGLMGTMMQRMRNKKAVRTSIREKSEMIVRPVRFYQIEDGELNRPITDLGEVGDIILQSTRRGEAGIVDLVDRIIFTAIRTRASDIHIEPGFDTVMLKYRLDGVLHDVAQIPKNLLGRLVSRFRVLANLTIYERDKPQDGRIEMRIEGRNYDVRLSIVPTLHGEKAVIRLFESGEHQFDLSRLGMNESTYENLSDLLLRPQGTIFLTGPTGSGKTTTIYSALKYIVHKKGATTNIVTIEDPIECEMPGVNQMQVNPRKGLDFAEGLRSLLRQDPDIIVVGEVRDKETAEICTQAGLTGHLVISTIHAESTVGVFNRLIDMGIEPFLVASSICGILSQRLVRKNCPHCSTPAMPSLKSMKALKISPDEEIVYVKGRGCDACYGKGFMGRIGIFELLIVNRTIREALQQKKSTAELMEIARGEGMRTLRDDGLEKVKKGLIDLDELARVLVV